MQEHRIPSDWEPSPSVVTWARDNRPELNLTAVINSFREHFMVTGEPRASWDAAFQAWVKRERVAPLQPGATAAPSPRLYIDAGETARMLAANKQGTGPPSAEIRRKLMEARNGRPEPSSRECALALQEPSKAKVNEDPT